MLYLLFSIKLMRIVASSARIAESAGLMVVDVLPEVRRYRLYDSLSILRIR
ncbi:MAG: hypothetical protein IJ299_00980 [Oscillospiraceae bacterium]|nr:hypothetical protein [Oscillospiraceae bacterium]